MFPTLEQCFRLPYELLRYLGQFPEEPDSQNQVGETDSLLPWFSDVSIGLEYRADVHGLAAPHVPLDAPIEGEFETAAV